MSTQETIWSVTVTDRRIEVVAEVHSRAHMGADGVEADEKAWKWHWLNCAYCYNLTNVVVQSLDADWVAHLDERTRRRSAPWLMLSLLPAC